jgi:hypothetical protein
MTYDSWKAYDAAGERAAARQDSVEQDPESGPLQSAVETSLKRVKRLEAAQAAPGVGARERALRLERLLRTAQSQLRWRERRLQAFIDDWEPPSRGWEPDTLEEARGER